jgi:hypothetical protein
VVRGRHVEERVVSVACASAVEAVEANVEAAGVVLRSRLASYMHGVYMNAYDGVKALGTVLSVHGLCWSWWTEL